MRPLQRPTRILLISYAFAPSIGGIESASVFFAEQFVRRGLQVQIVTNTEAAAGYDDGFGFPVHRRPGRGELLGLVRWSDLVFQNNISVSSLWPLMLAPRPLVITNQTPIDATIEHSAWKRWLKAQVMRAARCVSVSQFLADSFAVPSRVIYNPSRADLFYRMPEVARTRELIFVGRLSDSKGVDVLLQALSLLRGKDRRPGLLIVGGGPEEEKLKKLSTELDLDGQVVFAGPKLAPEIARLLNQHEIMVVPSRRKPAEGLGIVAMEGIACGAVPVVADQGGLPEAIGPCGLTFECENPQSLADALERVLSDPLLRESLRTPAAKFLHRFSEEVVIGHYLEVFADALPAKQLSFSKQNG